jgi:AbrB family looped-hinge helix DNA binding protein
MATVKLGPKGQIVIPKEARDLLGLQPGDSLLLLARGETAGAPKGIALVDPDQFQDKFAQYFPTSH